MSELDYYLAALLALPIVIGLFNRQYGLTWVVCASLFGVLVLSEFETIDPDSEWDAIASLAFAGLYVIAGAAAAMLRPRL